jgi:hypothetical protein
MAALEDQALEAARAKGSTGSTAPVEWDGVCPCPTCGREPIDEEPWPIERLVDELLADAD